MKKLIALVAVTLMSGCSTYNTHLKTGCIWSCAEWEQRLAQGSTALPESGSSYTPSGGMSAHTYNLPNASYMVIRSGSTTSVIQTSRSR